MLHPLEINRITDLMCAHAFKKSNVRKVCLRNMVLLEKEYQDILRYVLMILASVRLLRMCRNTCLLCAR